MAKLDRLPELAIIKGFRGYVDFYLWKGIPVARKWPRKYRPLASPAMLATQQLYADITRSWKDLAPTFQEAAATMTQSTQQRPMDLFIAAQYQKQIHLSSAYTFPTAGDDAMATIPIVTSLTQSATAQAVNATSYVVLNNLAFVIPWDIASWNRYRLVLRGNASQAGHTIDCRIQEAIAPTPLGDGDPDLTADSNPQDFIGSIRSVVTAPITATSYRLALKGSNNTVDLNLLWATLYLWQVEP